MNTVFVTGDTHADFSRFEDDEFLTQHQMSRDDYVIICGDFGGVWDAGRKDAVRLDFLEHRPFTILFVDGNHENFDALKKYPVTEWNGGKVHKIRENVIHLMRGQVFDLCGKKFFTMGGAKSHDIQDGILDPEDPDFHDKFFELYCCGASFRVNHRSWWKEELPSVKEYQEAMRNLKKNNFEVDYILTHCAPSCIQKRLRNEGYEPDKMTAFLDNILDRTDFRSWFCGHYHIQRNLKVGKINRFGKDSRMQVLYESIVAL